MARVAGTYRNGRVELSTPVDWPDGVRVFVELKVGLDDEDWPITPEGIEAMIREMDEIPPPTPEEAADFERALAQVRSAAPRPAPDPTGPINGPAKDPARDNPRTATDAPS